MSRRLTSCVLLAVLMSAVMLVPGRGTAQPGDEPLAHLPSRAVSRLMAASSGI